MESVCARPDRPRAASRLSRSWHRGLLAGVFLLAAPVHAASISGILLYAADGFGTPNGYQTYDACASIEAQLWRTMAADKWHGLAVYLGLPPQSLNGPPLNARNFMVEIPLNDGENDFTLVGEPGPLTPTDEYEGFVVNLYFDGNWEAAPGLSAFFPRYAAPFGDTVSQNRSHCIYTLSLNEVQAKPGVVYDNGVERVSVTGASFLSMDRFDPEWRFDLVGPRSFGPSGVRDWIGVLRVFVEPSVTGIDAGAAPRAVVPAAPRSNTGSGGFVPGIPGAPVAPLAGPEVYAGGGNTGGSVPSQAPVYSGGQRSAVVPTPVTAIPHPGRDEADSESTQATAEDTPSPSSTSPTAEPSPAAATTQSPTAAARGTPSPGATRATSPSPGMSPTQAGPAAPGIHTPTPQKGAAKPSPVGTPTAGKARK